MQEITKARALRCPCGARMEASRDEALLGMLREHMRREHPYVEEPPDERVKQLVSKAVYGFEHVPLGPEDGLEEQGFGPEPY